MGVLLQVLEVMFEMQRKRINEKNNKKKNKTYTTCFFFLFEPLLLSNLITFLFLIHFKQFKVL
jgi:F0F1-type ATP synthase membrane subunit a